MRAVLDLTLPIFRTNMPLNIRLRVINALFQLKKIPQKNAHNPNPICFGKHKIRLKDAEEVQFLIKEIWLEEVYKFPPGIQAEKIADVGANQGLAFLYFKHHFPFAAITAIEPDADNFELLVKNTALIKQEADSFINKAAWNCDEWLSSGTGTSTANKSFVSGNGGNIPAFDFAEWLLTNPQDVVKLDVEGAEAEVMDAVIQRNALTLAKCWFIEFHTERFGSAVFDRVKDAFSGVGYEYSGRGIIGCFYKIDSVE